jgi:Asparagine synthase (glutamine-hydrolyzing)
MCGIAGFTWRDKDLAQRMCDVIAHRGPDQHGIHDEEGITLGFRRLSILDLSQERGSTDEQPRWLDHAGLQWRDL